MQDQLRAAVTPSKTGFSALNVFMVSFLLHIDDGESEPIVASQLVSGVGPDGFSLVFDTAGARHLGRGVLVQRSPLR